MPSRRKETACVVSKGSKPEIDRTAIDIADILRANGIEPYLVKPLSSPRFPSLDSSALVSKEKIGLVVVVGGDGTILKTIRNVTDDIPVLGVNMGGRGLLAEIPPQLAGKAIKSIAEGKYILDRRIRLVTKVGRKTLPPALNEVYVDRLTKLRAPTYTISIDGEGPIYQRMDGVMISTPTGSTGHSLSFGSTIVGEGIDAFILTPVAPVSRIPAIVIPPCEISIKSTDNSNVLIDGQLDFPFRSGKKIRITKHDKDTFFVRFASSPFRQLKRLGF